MVVQVPLLCGRWLLVVPASACVGHGPCRVVLSHAHCVASFVLVAGLQVKGAVAAGGAGDSCVWSCVASDRVTGVWCCVDVAAWSWPCVRLAALGPLFVSASARPPLVCSQVYTALAVCRFCRVRRWARGSGEHAAAVAAVMLCQGWWYGKGTWGWWCRYRTRTSCWPGRGAGSVPWSICGKRRSSSAASSAWL
ncbi:hypothetical protein JB92DRAFT_2828118 [Gautieria morchelliformis]|nr:hypothetical protein JB92DRAFT_2828118 [Gautieria morchelliformis]